jgi:hypothetical protein
MAENKKLLQQLNDLHHKINVNNVQLYNIETGLENLDIFEQHMTSLNLRCEFLDKQISNLEYKNLPSNNKKDQKINQSQDHTAKKYVDFNSKIELRTTETTLENLCNEFSYLQDQLTAANEQIITEPLIDNESIDSQLLTSESISIFSNVENCSTDDGCTIIMNSSTKEKTFDKSAMKLTTTKKKKKKLLKMESFLNFKENLSPEKPRKSDQIGPLKGFRINLINENPLFDEKETKPSVKNKISMKSIHKRLKLVDLPSIDEDCFSESNEQEYDMKLSKFSINNNTETYKREEDKENDYYNLSNDCTYKQHRRRFSLPETSSLEGNNIQLLSEDPLRHFISHDTGLNSKYHSKNYNITDFLFMTKENIPDSNPNFVSSSSILTFKDSYIDNENYEEFSIHNGDTVSLKDEIFLDEFESDESYGDEDATPLILKKESNLRLRKCKSDESFLSTIDKSARFFPLREKNLDLKAQTMKWLKPNIPTVSSSIQPLAVPSNLTITNSSSNAHDNIIGILQSSSNKNTDSIPVTPVKIPTIPANNVSSSWVPTKLCTSPMPVPMPVPIAKSIKQSSNTPISTFNDEHKSSWISSFIPNSAFTNPEVGKLIKPSNKNINILGSSESFHLKSERRPLTERSVNVNGPSSSLTIKKNGSRIIKHGYGSTFNENVLSSRVSHSALREALEIDMI